MSPLAAPSDLPSTYSPHFEAHNTSAFDSLITMVSRSHVGAIYTVDVPKLSDI